MSVMVSTFTDTAGGPAMMIGQKREGHIKWMGRI